MAGLLGVAGHQDTAARKKKPKKKCRKLGQTCDINVKKKRCCNAALGCAQMKGKTGDFCCKQIGHNCKSSDECCGLDVCDVNKKCVAAAE